VRNLRGRQVQRASERVNPVPHVCGGNFFCQQAVSLRALPRWHLFFERFHRVLGLPCRQLQQCRHVRVLLVLPWQLFRAAPVSMHLVHPGILFRHLKQHRMQRVSGRDVFWGAWLR